MRIAKVLCSLLVVGALAGACGGDSGGDPGTDTTDAGSVALTTTDFAFSPAALTAAVGDTIEFSNEDDVIHSFTSETAGIDQDADGGETVSISLADVEAGSYEFVCKFHDDMKGNLTVE